jgi:hypothetical protein
MTNRAIVKGQIMLKGGPNGEFLLLYVDEGYPGAPWTELRFYGDWVSQEFYNKLLHKGDWIKAEAVLEHGKYMRMYKNKLELLWVSPKERQERIAKATVYH